MASTKDSSATPHLGSKAGIALFAVALVAFVAETELTQYLQADLGFRKPYFIFYVVHSSFIVLFPIHFLLLLSSRRRSTRPLLKGLTVAVNQHLSRVSHENRDLYSLRLAISRLWSLLLPLTLSMSVPTLLWFTAVSLAPVSDVTAIWNTNALWTWVLTVIVFKLPWNTRRLLAVILATIGVFAVVYGGSQTPSDASSPKRPTAPIIGDMATLLGSILSGLYQVVYKKYAALPSDPELASEEYQSIEEENQLLDPESSALIKEDNIVYPPPFAFHANLISSGIGLCTMLVFWTPLPILHYCGWEHFALPPDLSTLLAISGIALFGVVFNGTYMILLGLWGPIVTSVGNLLTIVLVLLVDVVFGGAIETLTAWSLLGSGIIVLSFGVLAYQMQHGH